VKVVAGLGNPGKKYENTPHNIGFNVLDVLAEGLNAEWKTNNNFNATVAKVAFKGEPLLLVKPGTFMNLSGCAVAPIMRYFRCRTDELTVVVDDADLPLGKIRIRARGGAGGHNGLASIIEHLGTEEFARVRVGVGRAIGNELVEHVLNKFADNLKELVSASVNITVDAVLCLLENDLNESMNRYNGWQYAAEVQPD
jgi:PTH1 family peptidyl-tRNA hydrolase